MLVALLTRQPAEDGHRDGRQRHHEEGVELLELLREDVDDGIHVGEDGIDAAPEGQRDDAGDEACLLRLGLEGGKQRVDADGDEGEGPDVEADLQPAAAGGRGVVAGEPGQRLTVLVEGHPEEYDDGKHQAQGHDALLGLFLRELLDRCFRSLRGTLLATLGMTECRAEDVIDGDGQDE